MTKPEGGMVGRFFKLVAPHKSHMDVSWCDVWYAQHQHTRWSPGPALPIDFPVRNCTHAKYGMMTARFQHPVRDHGAGGDWEAPGFC